jgi:hypothetical protein
LPPIIENRRFMRKYLLVVLVVVCAVSNVKGQESKPLGLYTELTFASRSIFHGWDIAGDNKPVLHPFIKYSVGKTGLSLAAWASMPLERKYNHMDDFEFLAMYDRQLFKDQKYAIGFNGFADLVCVPQARIPDKDGNNISKVLWKLNIGFSMPSLIKVGQSAIVPSYNLFHFTPFVNRVFTSGSVHEFALAYKIPVRSGINLSLISTYDDGAFGNAVGWTCAVGKLSFNEKVGPVNINGGINYQKAYGTVPNDQVDDEFWFSLGINKSF